MRISLFTALLYVAFLVAPNAFADTLEQPLSNVTESTPPPAVNEITPQNWAGFYAGLIAGAQFGRSSDKTKAFGYNADNDEWHYNESGLNAGAELGYSYLWRQFVVGPEVELGYLKTKGHGAQPASPGLDTVGKSDSDFYTAARVRIGIPHDSYLWFATGGVMGMNDTKKVVDSCSIAPCGGGTVYASKEAFVWGYTVGGGVERVFKTNWSVKLEYLYFSLNRQNFNGTTNLGNVYSWTGRTDGSVIRGGVNYYFG